MAAIDSPALPDNLDALSQYGAGLLARHIERYWKDRGFPGVVAERFEVFPGSTVNAWGVRSNLVAGLPPRVVS